MKKPIVLISIATLLTGCLAEAWNGTGTEIGSRNGKVLYETSCQVQLRLVGRNAVIGPNRGNAVSDIYSCEPQARTTCENGFTISNTDRGLTYMDTFVTDNGFQRITERVRVQDVSIQYTCN